MRMARRSTMRKSPTERTSKKMISNLTPARTSRRLWNGVVRRSRNSALRTDASNVRKGQT